MNRPLTRAELDALIRQHGPAAVTHVMRVHGGRASQTGALFEKYQIELQTPDGLLSLEWLPSSTCDLGHLLGAQGNEIAGICVVGGEFCCTAPGCAFTCTVGGEFVCRRHATVNRDGVFCSRHFHRVALKAGAKAVGAFARFIGHNVRGYLPFSWEDDPRRKGK